MKILIAVDDSSNTCAITQAISLHGWKDAEIVLLHAVEPLKVGNIASILPGPIVDEMFKTNWNRACSTIASLAAELKSSLNYDAPIKEEVLEGSAVLTILQYASKWEADLIVVGSHGKSGFGHIMLGSVALHVVAQANCSVLVIRTQLQKN
ncbi:universal stress protein [soil metagenome]